MTEIKIGGAGTHGALQPGWNVSEDATPNAIGDSSGAVDSVSLSIAQGEDSEFLLSENAELLHDDLGTFFGTVSTANSNGASEATNTTIPLSMAGVARTLTAERTAGVISGGSVVFAGLSPIAGGGKVGGANVAVGHIATGPGRDTNLYRVDAGPTAGTVSISTFTPARQKTSTPLTGVGAPTDHMLVTGFTVSQALFILFYTVAGVRRLGFFNRTTGVLTNVIGSNGTGTSQFGTGPNMQRIYWSSANDRVYVTDFGNNRVQVFSTTGTFVTSFAHTRPVGVAGGAYGIYVSDASTVGSPAFTITAYSFSNVFVRTIPVNPTFSFATTPGGDRIITTSSATESSSALMVHDAANGDLLSSMDSAELGGALYVRSTLVSNDSFAYVTVLNSTGYQVAMVGTSQATLYTIFAYCAELGGVASIVSFEATTNPVLRSREWTDTPWNKMKELASATAVEIAAVNGILVMRDMGTRTLNLDTVQGGSVSLGLSTTQGARSVLVNWRTPQGVSGAVELLTGANPAIVGSQRAADISNHFISSESQAYDRGVWRAEQLNGVSMELNATVPTGALDGFGLTSGSLLTFKECIYRITSSRIGNAWTSITAIRHVRQSDVQPLHAGKTMGQIDSFWAGTKYKDQIIKPLKDAPADLYPDGAVGLPYYATADSFGTFLSGVTSYITLLTTELTSSPYTNVSLGGRWAADGANAGWGTSSPIPFNLGANSFAHIAYGINPAYHQGLNALTRKAEKDALELLIWSMCVDSKLSNDDWAKVGAGWSAYANTDLKDGSAYLASTSGNYATLTPAAGSYIGVGYSFSTAGGSTVAGTGTWTRGGTVIQANDNSKPPGSTQGAILAPRPIRLLNMNGSTQVRVDSVSSQFTLLDSLVKLTATPPWIVVVKPTYVTSGSAYPIPNSTIDAYRADIDSVVESIGSSYAPIARKLVVVDPVAVGWNPSIHTAADGLHPNALGAQFLSDATRDAIAFAMAYPPMV